MEQAIIQTLNSQSKNMQIDVRVITLDDNLFHPYFTSIDISKDNLSPIGIAKAITVYSPDILNYWANYKGTVIMSFNMKEMKHLNTNSTEYAEAHELPQRLTNNEYNYSLICKISKMKQKGKEIIIYFEDLGWKFLQKVPSEFRNSFIAGQSLDKAFQAICEFLGVQFAYSVEALQEYNFSADGYSIEKDGEVIETVHTILSEENKTQEEEEEEENPLDQEDYENQSLMEYDNEHKNDEDYLRNDRQNNTNIDESNEEENSKIQEEFDKKIINLFIGNTYYESDLTSNILDYGRITITPTTSLDTTNNSDSISNLDTDNDGDVDETDTKNISKRLTDNTKSNIPLSGLTFTKSMLTFDQVNKLTPDQAYKESLRKDHYYHTTILRLRARAFLKHNVDASIDYRRFNY